MSTLTLGDHQQREAGGEWDALLGQTVGSYRIVRLLGRGGMGSVYLARQPAIGAQVAIKFLHPRFSADRGVVERFFNEARAVNLIGHENILKILDFSVTPEGRYYFVMELLEGKPLSALLGEKKEPQPLSLTGPILLQCCRALQAAHGRGIVHRDLKPDNVFLVQQMGRKNFVKLLDFGIAKLEEAEGANARPGPTAVGTVIGTPEYMSPEQAAGRTAEVGRRSDIYSLGIVMYQLACGRVPFSGASTAQTLVAQMETPPPPPRSLVPAIPEAFEAVILKALAKRREDRFQSMQDLHGALLEVMKGLGVSAELPFADEAPAPVILPPEGTPDEQIDTLLGPPPESKPKTAPERPRAREIDPRFATQPPPATQTAVQAPLAPDAQAARAGDYLFAPHRRRYLVGGAAVVLLGLLGIALRPRGAAPAPASTPEVRAQPALQPPHAPSSPAPGPPEPVQQDPPALRPASPAQLAVAAQEKAKQHKAARKAHEEPAKPAPAAPAQKAAGAAKKVAVPVQQPTMTAKGSGSARSKPVTESSPKRAPAAEKTPAGSGGAGKQRAAKPAADPVAQATKELTAAAEAAVQAEASQKPVPRSAKLFVVSDPLGAQVTAAWAGKSASGEAPVVFRVLRGAKVTVTFSLPGHAPDVKEVEAEKSQVVVGVLKAAQ